MAHLSARGDAQRPPGTGSVTDDGRDRAQLILVTGFIIAVTVVALALVVNSAIYTENLATRSEASGAEAAVAYQEAIEDSAAEAMARTNAMNETTHAPLVRNVSGVVENVSTLSARQEVRRGHVPTVTIASTTNGTAINHTGGNFDNAMGQDNRTIVFDGRVRSFRIFVSDADALNASGDREFTVLAEESGTTTQWVMNVTESGSSGTVTVRNASGGVGSCSASGSSFWINVTAGTVDGTPCDPLTYAEGVEPTHTLRFLNASAVEGNFSVVVSKDLVDEPRFDQPETRTRAVIYSMDLGLAYRTPQLQYRTEIRVVPGDRHD